MKLVRLDPNLGQARINQWARACEQASLSTYLELSSTCKQKTKKNLLSWGLIRIFDLSAAILLLLTLSPVILILVVLTSLDSSEPILLRQWDVGHRGKLFRILKFRTTGGHEDHPGITWLGQWMLNYKLDELPQLFNVLRGDISLIGPRYRKLTSLLKNK